MNQVGGRRGPWLRPPGVRGRTQIPDDYLGPNSPQQNQPTTRQPITPVRQPSPFGGDRQPGQATQNPPQSNTSMPWLQAWEGPFAAPMTPWENQGLSGLSDFASNDFGLGEADDYLSRVFGGEFLGGNDPNFQAIEDSGMVLKNMEDERVMRELQSRAAAGGNALSGALMGQEADYMRGSNAAFNNMMAQLRAANYGRERGFQQDAVRASMGMSDQRLGGFGALMGAGAVPRSIADQEIAGQYEDFLRQGRDFREAARYPDELALATARTGYPGSHPVLFGESDAEGLAQLLAQIFGGGGLGSGIGDFFGGLLGGGEEAQADGVQYDGEQPTSYRDSQFYNAALTSAQRANAEKAANPGKASGAGKSMMILALLAQVLGLGKQGGGKKSGGGGGGKSVGQGLGESARKGIDALFNKNKLGDTGLTLNKKTGQLSGTMKPPKGSSQQSRIDAIANEMGPIEVDEVSNGDFADQSDWSGDDSHIDSALFGEGDTGDVWDDIFDSSDWDTMGGGNFDPSGSFDPDSGGFDLGPDDFSFGGWDDVFSDDFSGGGFDMGPDDFSGGFGDVSLGDFDGAPRS